MIKPSVFSKIRVTSPIIEALRLDLKQERKSFVESLNANQMASAFPPSSNLGVSSAGAPITPDQIASHANAAPVAQTQDGSQVQIDPVTGKLIIVSNNPDDVVVQKPEDAAKLEQLAQLAQQTNQQQAIQPSQQDQTHSQNVAQQKAVQTQAVKRVNESEDTLADFTQHLHQLFSSGPKYNQSGNYDHGKDDIKPDEDTEKTTEKADEAEASLKEDDDDSSTESSTSGGGELNEEDDETSDSGRSLGFDTGNGAGGMMSEEGPDENHDKPAHSDGLVEVDHVNDTLLDPNEVITSMGDIFWTPPSQKDLKDAVMQAQTNVGFDGGSVQEEPRTVITPKQVQSRPNMAQHVKTGLNQMQGMPGNAIGNDFDDILGIDNPIAIKLALTIGK